MMYLVTKQSPAWLGDQWPWHSSFHLNVCLSHSYVQNVDVSQYSSCTYTRKH